MNDSGDCYELSSMDCIPIQKHDHEIHDRYTLKAPHNRTYENESEYITHHLIEVSRRGKGLEVGLSFCLNL